MPKIDVNFEEAGRRTRERIMQALTELAPLAFPDGPPPHPAWWAELAASGLNPAHSATAPID